MLLAALLAVPTGCEEPAPLGSNILLITVDTLRPDYLSLNGYDRATTPRLDAILAKGMYFEHAVSPIARTTPALASLLTAAYPHTTGVRTLTHSLRPDVKTLTEVFDADGYQTLAVVTNQVLVRERELWRGFDTYDMDGDTRSAAATTRRALSHFASLDPDKKTFIWVHYIDPHTPYHPDPAIAAVMDPGYTGRFRFNFGNARQPGQPRNHHKQFPKDLPKRIATHRNKLPNDVNAHIRRLYAGDIRRTDVQIDRLVGAARKKLGDDLIIVFTADHGESLGEHDFFFDHGDYAYNAGTRVPLAIVLPQSHPMHRVGRCSGWVSLTDVAPTLLEIDGRDPKALGAQTEGRSLAACLKGKRLDDVPIFSESGDSFFFDFVRGRQKNGVPGRFRTVTLGDWKLIWTPFASEEASWQLYNVADDPDEENDLHRADHPQFAPLKAHLDEWLARQPASDAQGSMSEQDLQALRELGYLDDD
jgi:arylsulfatase